MATNVPPPDPLANQTVQVGFSNQLQASSIFPASTAPQQFTANTSAINVCISCGAGVHSTFATKVAGLCTSCWAKQFLSHGTTTIQSTTRAATVGTPGCDWSDEIEIVVHGDRLDIKLTDKGRTPWLIKNLTPEFAMRLIDQIHLALSRVRDERLL